MKVPCGDCHACCQSSYYIHINKEETRTLSRIPKELLFPAPYRPPGHMVLGYDSHGRCPMLLRDTCTIYSNRPATCRSFDCRILTASGLVAENSAHHGIFQQARRWKFSCPSQNENRLLSAVQDAAKFLNHHPLSIEDNFVSRDEVHLSVLAIKVYDVFLPSGDFKRTTKREIDESVIMKKVLRSYEKFQNRCAPSMLEV
jgi:uncharacterized protein